MFKRWFGGGERGDEGAERLAPGPQLCMPLFASGKGLTPKEIAAAWRELFGLGGFEIKAADRGVLEVKVDGGAVYVMPMPAPVPGAEIGEAMERSWMFQRGRERVAGHTLHAIVTAIGGQDAVAEAKRVTRVTAALAKAGDCVGVYWGNGAQVHQPAFFIDTAQHAPGLGAMLWVGLMVTAPSPKGPFTLSSTGMRAFGQMELEILDAPMELGELRLLAIAVIEYLLEHGPVLEHGHTFGRSDAERFAVEHGRSEFRDERVLRVRV